MQGLDLSCSLVIPSKLPGETSFSLFTLINGEGGKLALGLAMLLRISVWMYSMSFHGGLWLQEKAMRDPQESGDMCSLSLLSFLLIPGFPGINVAEAPSEPHRYLFPIQKCFPAASQVRLVFEGQVSSA